MVDTRKLYRAFVEVLETYTYWKINKYAFSELLCLVQLHTRKYVEVQPLPTLIERSAAIQLCEFIAKVLEAMCRGKGRRGELKIKTGQT